MQQSVLLSHYTMQDLFNLAKFPMGPDLSNIKSILFFPNLAYSLNEAHGYKLNNPYPFRCIWIAKYVCATKLQREFVLPWYLKKREKYCCRSITSVIFLFANSAWISLTLKSLRQLQEIATETNSSSEPTSHCQCFVVSQSIYKMKINLFKMIKWRFFRYI